MEFFPLTLGIPKLQARREEVQEREPSAPQLTYEAWREGLSGPEEEVNPCPAGDVLCQMTRGDPAMPMQPWLILGEPGAGKTSLLEHWHRTWLRALSQPHLGMRVPVLVRLRDVACETLTGDPAVVADDLWTHGLAASQDAARGTAVAVAFTLPARMFTPVWLLDGLDELATSIAERGLWDRLRALPGEVVLTCRTAVFQAARAEIAGRVGGQWHLLGLRSEKEQTNFLTQAYVAEGFDSDRAVEMVRDLNANSALRPLAAMPLLLKLVAEAGPHLILPATRAGFYERATAELWSRRLRGQRHLLDLAPERDVVLATLATSMGLNILEARPEALRRAGAANELREALRRSGLLHFDDRRGRVGFPHLTFQEFHLARAFLERPFGEVLREHWRDVRYEEVLALLIALHAEEGRLSTVETELREFVCSARADHAANPSYLRSLGRSPLRTVLHLLTRAAVSPDPTLPISLPNEPLSLRLAVASDVRAPAAALTELARDPDPQVRWTVARSVATPAAARVKLARDSESRVRWAVAQNTVVPTAALDELARDPDPNMRHWACCRAMSAGVLAELAHDPDPLVRSAVASNARTPAEALAQLACDSVPRVRSALTGNTAAPAAALADLAHHPDPQVRESVMRNVATPIATLVDLARDPEPEVRARVARNAATPAATLTELTRDPCLEVRLCLLQNSAVSAKVIAELARDLEPRMRRAVAPNALVPAAIFADLARDPDPQVRQGAAESIMAPAAMLAELARDPESLVHWALARNTIVPEAVFADLARDPDSLVRQGAAGNSAAPSATLMELARDSDPQVRWAVKRNAVVPGVALAELAHDSDAEMRREVASNTRTPAATLAELAHDPDPQVQWAALSNGQTPAATLAELARVPDFRMLSQVARNVATPAAALADLARAPDLQVRRAVASNAKTPATALASLACDSDSRAQSAVAQNAAAPAAALIDLACDPDPQVRLAVARSPATPAATLAELARDPDQQVRWGVAQNAAAPAAALTDLAHDAAERIRSLSLQNAALLLEDLDQPKPRQSSD